MESINTLRAYVRMILDGSAFSNWENKPDVKTRKKIIENIIDIENENNKLYIDLSNIEGIYNEINEENAKKEIERLLNSMKFTEEEFEI